MTGMSREGGGPIADLEHLKQSVGDILSTPIGSRVMRRDYGSRLFQLTDAPLHSGTLTEIYVATAEALRRWEPRLKVTKIRVAAIQEGHLTLTLEGRYRPEGRPITLEGIVV